MSSRIAPRRPCAPACCASRACNRTRKRSPRSDSFLCPLDPRKGVPMASANVIAVDDKSFDKLVLGTDQPVLIKFSTQNCPPCRALSPIVDRIADEGVGKYRVFSVDI